MATTDIDIILHVYQSTEDNRIGLSSKYTTTEHPGSNRLIEGWKWDQRTWPTDGEFDAAAHAPSIWDPSISGISEEYLQAGYGDNRDLLFLDIKQVASDGTEVWAPLVEHGFFYTYGDKWYLYSDSHQTEYFTVTGVESGQQVLTLDREYKPTIPIQVRTYGYNRVLARHEIFRDFRKKVEFTSPVEGPEFVVDTDTNPPKLILNGIYADEVGVDITLSVSGTTDPTNTLSLDYLGYSDGEGDQSFLLSYSPVDPDSSVDIWTWKNPSEPTLWTTIDPLDSFTTASSVEVKLDRDRGIITFGDYDPITMVGSGLTPIIGHQIGAYYTRGIEARYEPVDTTDEILAYNEDANINPIQSSISRGFVQLNTESTDPTAVTLSSDLDLEGSFYQVELGNNVGQITAAVNDQGGSPVNGQRVTFEILAPVIGTFGSLSTTTVSATNADGEASVLYVSPRTIDIVGNATVDVGYSGSDTIVSVENLLVPATLDDLYIYKVHESDDVLGILDTDLASYYTDYITEQGYAEGDQATTSFEQDFRTNNNLGIPTTYTSSELTVGKKTIVLTSTKTDVMDPHTGSIVLGTLAPLSPSATVNTGTSTTPILSATYSNVTLDAPGTNGVKSYFLVGNASLQIRAYVTNPRTNRRIYSNTINLEISIPDTANGTYYSSILNDIPDNLLTVTKDISDLSTAEINATSGVDGYYRQYLDERNWVATSGIHEFYEEWFVRTKKADTVGLTELTLASPDGLGDPTYSGLNFVEAQDSPSEIPMGFRLRSTGVTIASVLDQVTYLDPNDEKDDDYYE